MAVITAAKIATTLVQDKKIRKFLLMFMSSGFIFVAIISAVFFQALCGLFVTTISTKDEVMSSWNNIRSNLDLHFSRLNILNFEIEKKLETFYPGFAETYVDTPFTERSEVIDGEKCNVITYSYVEMPTVVAGTTAEETAVEAAEASVTTAASTEPPTPTYYTIRFIYKGDKLNIAQFMSMLEIAQMNELLAQNVETKDGNEAETDVTTSGLVDDMQVVISELDDPNFDKESFNNGTWAGLNGKKDDTNSLSSLASFDTVSLVEYMKKGITKDSVKYTAVTTTEENNNLLEITIDTPLASDWLSIFGIESANIKDVDSSTLALEKLLTDNGVTENDIYYSFMPIIEKKAIETTVTTSS